jgi:hypothetical protein
MKKFMSKLDERQKVFLAIAIVFCFSLLVTLFFQYNSSRTKKPCNLAHGVCAVVIGQQGRATLNITPRTISPDSRVGLEVTLVQVPAQSVVVDIVNGANPSCSTQTELTEANSGTYTATASVPSCAVATKRWLFVVRAQNGPNAYAIPFRLTLKTAE